jgi:hypothetical protein
MTIEEQPTPEGMADLTACVRSLATGPVDFESTGGELLVRAMDYMAAAVVFGTVAWMLWLMVTGRLR